MKMADAKQQVAKGMKTVKKNWYPIIAGKAFNSSLIGESIVAFPESLVGRKVTITLANLTGDIRQQSTGLKFTITNFSNGAAVADITGYEVAGTHLKRLVRRGLDRMDDSFSCVTADNRKVVVKTFAVTRFAATSSKLMKLRKMLQESIKNEIAKLSFEDAVQEAISNKLQIMVKKSLNKLHPLMALEIKRLELTEKQQPKAETQKPAEEPAKAAEPAKAVKEDKKAKEPHPKKEKKEAPSEHKDAKEDSAEAEVKEAAEGEKE